MWIDNAMVRVPHRIPTWSILMSCRNFPNGMITRKIAPALAAGCTVVIKAPAETPLSALALCGFCERVGIPKGVVNVVTVEKGEREAACGLEFCERCVAQCGEQTDQIARSPLISKISFTGSTAVGRLLMRQSSSTLKKMSMELGGNAACVSVGNTRRAS